MTPQDLHGFVPAIVTPFTRGGEIMEDAFVEIGRVLAEPGRGAICVAGDNGEILGAVGAERGRLVRCLKDALGVPVILRHLGTDAGGSLAYVRAGEENGADALLSMPPTYVLKASRRRAPAPVRRAQGGDAVAARALQLAPAGGACDGRGHDRRACRRGAGDRHQGVRIATSSTTPTSCTGWATGSR